jgi:dipeptidyl aminopeptidase/acylaminoacyl peptidase
VVAGNSLVMYEALRDAGVSAELHLFAEGGHGFGLRYVAGKPVETWPELLQAWIRALP